MAYDQELAQDVRALLAARDDVVEKPMFGGLGFMVSGNLAVCAGHTGELLVRVGPDAYAEARSRPGTRDFVMGDRTAKGWVIVDPASIASEAQLEHWVERGVAFAASLPPK